MCLTTSDPEIKVATEDIKVYKQLIIRYVPNENRTILQRLFGLKKTRMRAESIIQTHEYKIGETAPNVELVTTPFFDFFEVERGYHSDAEFQGNSNAILVIPKGAKYIQGWYNDENWRPNYVSETLILKEII
jgi:hypothetical protein